MDGSLGAVSTWEWVLAGVVAMIMLVITLMFTAPFWDEWRRARGPKDPPSEE